MMTAKQPDASGKGITMAVLVETYAILSLIVSILLIFWYLISGGKKWLKLFMKKIENKGRNDALEIKKNGEEKS